MTRVAAIQMVSSADVGLNLDVASRLLREARAQGARVATLPENFAFMGVAEADKFAIAENDGDGPIQARLASLASELGLWIVAGTIPLRVPGESPAGRGLPRLRRGRATRGALRQDPPVRRRDSGQGRALPGVLVGAARRRRRSAWIPRRGAWASPSATT